MRLARRSEQFGLASWLREFRSEFCATIPCPEHLVTLHEAAGELDVRCDRSQLHQIVWNLAHNAVKHHGGAPQPIELRTGKLSPTRPPPDRTSAYLAKRTIDICLTGQFLCAHHAVPLIKAAAPEGLEINFDFDQSVTTVRRRIRHCPSRRCQVSR